MCRVQLIVDIMIEEVWNAQELVFIFELEYTHLSHVNPSRRANRMLQTMTGIWYAHDGQRRQFIAIEEKDFLPIQFCTKNLENHNNTKYSYLFCNYLCSRTIRLKETEPIRRTHWTRFKRCQMCLLKKWKRRVNWIKQFEKNVNASLQQKDYSIKKIAYRIAEILNASNCTSWL